MGVTKCSECQKTFSARYNLRKHAKKFHPDKINVIVPRKIFNFQCESCKKNFTHRKHLNYHLKRQHGNEVNNSTLKTTKHTKKCPLCDYNNSQKENLIKHFNQAHDIIIKLDNLDFASFDDFITWKNNTEKHTKSRFVKKSGNATNRHSTIIRYACSRSGSFVTRGKGLRHLKTQGSNKINGFCPAAINVVIRNGKCKVKYLETHIGHENDLRHLFLNKSEREMLAAKLASKIPFSQILDEIRDSSHESQLERIHLLTKKDLHNIVKTFNLQSTVVRHHNDAVCVEAWVNQVQSSGCVLFYKPQETMTEKHPELKFEDFVLIIMNSEQEEMLKKYGSDCICLNGTRGLNQYDFELHALLVLDDSREGFPCGLLISNRADEQVMCIFLHYIKERIDGAIKCKVFLSDMAEAYYNAWKQIMGPAQFRLFCTWRVDRAWRKNLPKIECKEKQVTVYKYLRNMLQETDVAAFYRLLDSFQRTMTNDPVTLEFANYFNDNYINNVQSWAYCFRVNYGLNTNMHIERLHKTIKCIYFNSRKVKRLDKAINEILKFVRDKLFDRLITINKGKLCTKLKDIRVRHKLSEELDLNLVTKNGECWEIPSSSPESREVYTIVENFTTAPCDCRLICTDCDACIRKYSCTCLDSCINFNMCKHVHLLCRYLKQDILRLQQTHPSTTAGDESYLIINETNSDYSNEAIEILAGLSSPGASSINQTTALAERLADEKKELKAEVCKIIDAMESIEEIDAFKKLMAPIAPTLAAIKNSRAEMKKSCASLNPNKKIIPQKISYFLPKKKAIIVNNRVD